MYMAEGQDRTPAQVVGSSAHETAAGRLAPHRPWLTGQVRIANSWPTRRDQPVSIALPPTGDRMALAVGQRLTVSAISADSPGGLAIQLPCALTPSLTWSPGGNQLAFRDEDGKGRLL